MLCFGNPEDNNKEAIVTSGRDDNEKQADREKFEKNIEAVQRGEFVEGMPLDDMNKDDPDAIPKYVRGIVEKRQHTYWHSWIADSRPGGLGISRYMSFAKQMRMFCADQGDLRRTNMLCAGQLVSDRTMLINRFGLHVSFSDAQRYADFWRCCTLTFTVGDKPILALPASYFANKDLTVDPLELDMMKVDDPPPFDYEGGHCAFLTLTRNIVIPARQGLSLLMDFSDENFVEAMQRIERGAEFASYAEITPMFEGIETREVF